MNHLKTLILDEYFKKLFGNGTIEEVKYNIKNNKLINYYGLQVAAELLREDICELLVRNGSKEIRYILDNPPYQINFI
jgi:putative cell wall-binding protein